MSAVISTLRPGLLVSLHTSITGNVRYRTTEIEADHVTSDGARKAAWQTDRFITDAAEHAKGVMARTKTRSLVTSVCTASAFGLLCPEAKREDLMAAINEARELVVRFNAEAMVSTLNFYALIGRVGADDAEAVRAINSEVRELLNTMEYGLQRLDVSAVRDAANRARGLAQMLSPAAAEKAQAAIEAARTAARKIVKAGEAASIAIDEVTLATIRASRTAFLDIDPDDTILAPEIQDPTIPPRAVDLIIDVEVDAEDLANETNETNEAGEAGEAIDEPSIPRSDAGRLFAALELDLMDP
jgi:hypothetical protein